MEFLALFYFFFKSVTPQTGVEVTNPQMKKPTLKRKLQEPIKLFKIWSSLPGTDDTRSSTKTSRRQGVGGQSVADLGDGYTTVTGTDLQWV